jgi:hypothetical protein
MKTRIALALLAASVAAPLVHAGSVTLDFSGLNDQEFVRTYYDGGAGSDGSTTSQNAGVYFSTFTRNLIQSSVQLTSGPPPTYGSGNFGGGPELQGIDYTLGDQMIMSITNGIATGASGDTLSFWYSDHFPGGGLLNLYTEVNGINNADSLSPIYSVNLPQTMDNNNPPVGDTGPGCQGFAQNNNPGADFCPFTEVVIDLSGISASTPIMSVEWSGTPDQSGGAEQIVVQDISFNPYEAPACTMDCPATTPEPSTWLLFGTGAFLMLVGSRKLKLRKN